MKAEGGRLLPSAFRLLTTASREPGEPAGAEGRAAAGRSHGFAGGGRCGGRRGAGGGLVGLEGLDGRNVEAQVGLTDTTVHDDNLLLIMGEHRCLRPLSLKQGVVSAVKTDQSASARPTIAGPGDRISRAGNRIVYEDDRISAIDPKGLGDL